jgi:hypothetical protein
MARRVTLLILAFSLLLAGCGGPSKDEYSNQVRDIGDRVQHAGDELSKSNPTNSQELVKGLERTKAAVVSAAEDFEELDPPKDATDAHARTLRGIRRTSDDLDPIIAAARSGDLRELKRRLAGGFPSKETRALLTSAQKLYRDAGYDVQNRGG